MSDQVIEESTVSDTNQPDSEAGFATENEFDLDFSSGDNDTPAQTDETTQDEPAPDTQAAVDSDAAPVTDAANPEPVENKWSVPLQHVQQKQAALEKTIAQLEDRLASRIESLLSKPAKDEPPTPAQESAQSDLDDVLARFAKGDPDDLPTRGEVAEALAAAAKATGQRVNDPIVKQLAEEFSSLKQVVEQTTQQARQQTEYASSMAQLRQAHGFDCEPLWKQAVEKAQARYGDDLPVDVFSRIATVEMNDLIEAKKAQAAAPANKPVTRTPPPSDKPRTPAKGLTIKPNVAGHRANDDSYGFASEDELNGLPSFGD